MKKVYRLCAAVFALIIISLLTLTLMVQAKMPDDFYVAEGEEFYINSRLSIKTKGSSFGPAVKAKAGDVYTLKLSINNVAVKQVNVQVVPREMVIPAGVPFGIKMFTDGVIIVGMTDIVNGSENINPAKNAGLKIGDIILSINGKSIERNEDIKDIVANSGGKDVKVSFKRGSSVMEANLKPAKNDLDGTFRVGMWVRDSSAGIGTLTYYNPATMGFAGLGHAVCDIDTGKIMPLSSGEIVDVNISGVNCGKSGRPGELKGSFAGDTAMGRLRANTELGVFGTLNHASFHTKAVELAYKQEVEEGPAVILSTISGSTPQQFDIIIEKINYLDNNNTKNMVIRIADEKLLAETGGIVQGMSGSPILQNGRLVGAVTHVFVNDPTRGYAVFAENMEKTLKSVENNQSAA